MKAYEEGIKAAKDGLPVYANPYSDRGAQQQHFHQWFAGWCYAMRVRQ